jgi:hypothetical protein
MFVNKIINVLSFCATIMLSLRRTLVRFNRYATKPYKQDQKEK